MEAPAERPVGAEQSPSAQQSMAPVAMEKEKNKKKKKKKAAAEEEKEKKEKEKEKEKEGSKAGSGLRAIGTAVVHSAFQPLLSLRNTKVNRDSGMHLLGFALKVGALEIVRRHAQARCPPLWSAIQSLPLLQLPPFSWLHQWMPFGYLLIGSQMFSKPIMFLSIATRITEKLDELRPINEPTVTGIQNLHEESPVSENGAIVSAAISTDNMESNDADSDTLENNDNILMSLKEYLYKSGTILPERIGDDDLERFLASTKNDIERCAMLVKRNVKWRETFYFLSPFELENFSSLLFWHGYDSAMRPSLVVRIGLAYSHLSAKERPRFIQAILSQVEYGMTHLLREDDPRITVIIDCEGTPAIGFPVNLVKSCCTRVQENYPTRLAALFIVNLPPVVRVIALAIIRVLKPSTRKKIRIEGEDYKVLAEHCGGYNSMPKFLGGDCSCSRCNHAMSNPRAASLQLITGENQAGTASSSVFDAREEDLVSRDQDIASYNKFNTVLRAVIIGFLMLWVVVSLIAGFFDPDEAHLPT